MENTVNKLLPEEGYMVGSKTNALDPVETGQFGFLTNNRSWGHLRYQTKQNIIVAVLDYPRGFDALPNTERWVAMFKAIWEDMATVKEGFNWTVTPTFAESEHGGTGDMHHTMTDMKYTPSEPSTTLKERDGYVIEKFVTSWWKLLGMDPVTKRPGIFELDGVNKDDLVLSSDFAGGVLVAFEASECMRFVNKAQIIYNVQPKDGIESTGSSDKNAEKTIPEYSLTWTGTAVRDRGAEDVARLVLSAMTANNLSADNRKAILSDISSKVKAIKAGAQHQIDAEATAQREA